MKPSRRWLFNFAAALSLGMCVAVVSLWPMTRHRLAWILWDGDSEYWITSGGGVLRFSIMFGDRPQSGTDGLTFYAGATRSQWPARFNQPMTFFGEFSQVERLGFGLDTGRTQTEPRGGARIGGKPYLIVYTPHWFAAAALVAFPLWLLRKRISEQRRAKPGFCSSCGYDLRATPERCPECGTIAAGRYA